MAVPAWFDYNYYLTSKLRQLKKDDPDHWHAATVADVEQAFTKAGYVGEQGAYRALPFRRSERFVVQRAQKILHGVLQLATVSVHIDQRGTKVVRRYVDDLLQFLVLRFDELLRLFDRGDVGRDGGEAVFARRDDGDEEVLVQRGEVRLES